MPLYFLTGNKNKLQEIQAFLPDVEGLDIDLPEIQSLDGHEVIREKLKAAFLHHEGEFMVEDTSLYLDSMKGLPGPLIKWFLKTVGNEGLVTMAQSLGSVKAEARTIIGHAKDKNTVNFYEGVVTGEIVSPHGDTDFGWDSIFVPEGYDKTFAEMTKEEKNEISMRRMAVEKLKKALK